MDVYLSLPSIIALSFFLTILAPSYCNEDGYFKVCRRSYMCGNVGLSFPFWGGDRPKNCGLEGYELECLEGYPVMSFQELKFRVLRINSSSGIITVARTDLLEGLCPPKFLNTTLNYTLFDYASNLQNITMFYRCLPEKVPLPHRFVCSADTDDGTVNGFVEDSSQSIPLAEQLHANCKNSTQIPILKSSALLREPSDVRGALSAAIYGGFEVEYNRALAASCAPCAASGGECGSNATGSFVCFCEDKTEAHTCPKREGVFNRRIQLTLSLGVSLLVVVAAIIFYVMVCKEKGHFLSNLMIGERGRRIDAFNVEEIMKNFGSVAPKRYTYLDVKKMSNSFTNKVGQGGYGTVYKGRLLDGRIVAIKVLSESKGNGEEFINEVASISRTSYVNIVTLLGFCFERNKRALIYEFMPNGSLDKFIHRKGSVLPNCQLDINTMFKVVIGIARGLEYLHRGCNTRILHFDIKPHNILLDEDLCPKISDFGLAKLCKTKESIVSMMGMRGTPGYIAPEVFSRHFGGVSHKSDVYSYGMLILEMVGVRKNFDSELSYTSDVYFPYEVYNKFHNSESFGMFEGVMEEEEETIRKMTIVSLWCIQINPSDRPSMGKVIEMLEGTFQSLPFPPKPFLESPKRLPYDSSTASLPQNTTF